MPNSIPSIRLHLLPDTERSVAAPPPPMPPPGPAHYEARRALWLAPPHTHTHPAAAPHAHAHAHTHAPTDTVTPSPSPPPSTSTSRAKLEALLRRESKADDDAVWNAGLRSVWKGLLGGGRLRRRLPLAMVIQILKAGWQRDGTWAAAAVAGPPSPVPPLPSLPVAVPSRPREGTPDSDLM